MLPRNNLHDAVCLMCGVCVAGEPLRLLCLLPYCLCPCLLPSTFVRPYDHLVPDE
jgi:hypothetical protein